MCVWGGGGWGAVHFRPDTKSRRREGGGGGGGGNLIGHGELQPLPISPLKRIVYICIIIYLGEKIDFLFLPHYFSIA